MIEALVRLDEGEHGFIRTLSDHPLTNWNGLAVGALCASAELRKALN